MTDSERPIGLSVWEANLYEQLTNHVASEASFLDRYRALAEGTDGHVRFLLELIGEDEARHHRLYEQWADTIRRSAVFEAAPDGVPDLIPESDPTELVDAIDELLAVERADARHLKRLQRELRDVRTTTIWPLVVQTMQLDTKKHIQILEFLRHHANETARHQAAH